MADTVISILLIVWLVLTIVGVFQITSVGFYKDMRSVKKALGYGLLSVYSLIVGVAFVVVPILPLIGALRPQVLVKRFVTKQGTCMEDDQSTLKRIRTVSIGILATFLIMLFTKF